MTPAYQQRVDDIQLEQNSNKIIRNCRPARNQIVDKIRWRIIIGKSNQQYRQKIGNKYSQNFTPVKISNLFFAF